MMWAIDAPNSLGCGRPHGRLVSRHGTDDAASLAAARPARRRGPPAVPVAPPLPPRQRSGEPDARPLLARRGRVARRRPDRGLDRRPALAGPADDRVPRRAAGGVPAGDAMGPPRSLRSLRRLDAAPRERRRRSLTDD